MGCLAGSPHEPGRVIATVPWLDRLAHDLRGPLTPLQTAAYLLRSGQVEGERQQELFVLIERQTQVLVRMIEELSDWTRVSQDRLLGRREPCAHAMDLEAEPVVEVVLARRARLAAASIKAEPSSASLRRSEMPASNFFANSPCQLRNVSVHASTVYS